MSSTIESDRDWQFHWNAVASRVGPLDFFQQVERTVGGRPMDSDQIEFTRDAARDALDLNAADCLLDLCCGNGLVTFCLAQICRSVLGIDFSSYLIDIARHYHAASNITYLHAAVTALTPAISGGWRPTKISMLTSLQYFTSASLQQLIASLTAFSDTWEVLYISDIPDSDHLYDFYNTPQRRHEYKLRQAAGREAIGTWWNRQHLVDLFESHGYTARVLEQDVRRFGSKYRFDLLVQEQRCDIRAGQRSRLGEAPIKSRVAGKKMARPAKRFHETPYKSTEGEP